MLRAAFRGKHTNSYRPQNKESEGINELDPNVNGASCIQYSDVLDDKDEVLSLEGNQQTAVQSDMTNSESKRTALFKLSDKSDSLLQVIGDEADKNSQSSFLGQTSGDGSESFGSSERTIYEMQLVKLQEELVTAMIENQDMGEQLTKLKALNVEELEKELESEKKKNKELIEKLKRKEKAGAQKLSRKAATKNDPRHSRSSKCSSCNLEPEDCEKRNEEWVDLGHDALSGGRPLITADVADGGQTPDPSDRDSSPAVFTHVNSMSLPRTQVIEAQEVAQPPTKFENFKNALSNMIVDRLYDFLNDEMEDDAVEDNDGEALTVKTLKENINRFSNGIKPITGFIKAVSALISWRNPTATLLTFVIYMYAVWYGFLLPLVLLLIIWKLSLNYLYARGIATQLGFPKKVKDEAPQADDKTWSDKFQLVLQVARKVQNILGSMADSLEKLNNLFMWQHAEGSRKLFTVILVALCASLFLSGPTLFRLAALGFGVKMFIVRTIYSRFPKVKKRYDNTARLWQELPTDADIAARQNAVNDETSETVSSGSTNTSGQSVNHNGAQGDHSNVLPFHERMQLPVVEQPLPDWEEGRRCTLMNKDRPLHNMKHGRLYLTQNYFCFERSKFNPYKNFSIKIDSISQVSKYKPLTLLPGSGMALEICVRHKSFIFGAIIGRDEVYDLLHSAGRAANLPWAAPSRIEQGLARMGAGLAASSSRLHET